MFRQLPKMSLEGVDKNRYIEVCKAPAIVASKQLLLRVHAVHTCKTSYCTETSALLWLLPASGFYLPEGHVQATKEHKLVRSGPTLAITTRGHMAQSSVLNGSSGHHGVSKASHKEQSNES